MKPQQLEPLAGEITVGNLVLALPDLLEIRKPGLLLQQLLVLLERLLLLAVGLVTAGHQILRLRRVIRQSAIP